MQWLLFLLHLTIKTLFLKDISLEMVLIYFYQDEFLLMLFLYELLIFIDLKVRSEKFLAIMAIYHAKLTIKWLNYLLF